MRIATFSNGSLDRQTYVVVFIALMCFYLGIHIWQRYVSYQHTVELLSTARSVDEDSEETKSLIGLEVDQRDWVQSGIAGRLDDLSFWFGIAAFGAIYLTATSWSFFPKNIGDKNQFDTSIAPITFFPKHVAYVALLAALLVLDYVIIVFRDKGTFFHYLRNPADPDLIYFKQVIEGIMNIGVLSLTAFWAVVGHMIATKLKRLSRENSNWKSNVKYRTCIMHLLNAGLLLIAILLASEVTGFIIDFDSPLYSKFWGVMNSLILWIVYIALIVRLSEFIFECVELNVLPPWFKVKE